jgi:hypothetical protein
MCAKCFAICDSFSTMTLARVLEQKLQKETIAKEFKMAGDVFDSLPTQTFKKPAHVLKFTRVGCRLERGYWFISVKEFSSEHGLTPKDVGLKTMTVLDEIGTKDITGVLATPQTGDPQDRYRRLSLWSDKVRLLSEDVLGPGRQLRADHPKEIFDREIKTSLKVDLEDSRSEHLT